MNRVIFFLSALVWATAFGASATQVFAQAASTNFQLFGAQTTPIGGAAFSSTNFSLDAGGNPTGGRSTGTSFNANIGAPVGTALVATVSSVSSGTTSGSGGSRSTTVDAPRIDNVVVTPINRTQVQVTFDTDILAVTTLRYGTTPEVQTPEEAAFSRTHNIVLDNITPNLVYPLSIEARSVSGGVTLDDSFQFRIEQVLPSIPNVRNAQATVRGGNVALTWEAPDGDDLSYRIVRHDGAVNASSAAGTEVFSESALRFADTRVTVDSTYTYFIYTVADDGRQSSGVLLRATIGSVPNQPTPPTPAPPDDADVARPSPDVPPTTTVPPGVVVPAQPPALPDDVFPVDEEDSLNNAQELDEQISLLSVIDQHVSQRYLDARDALVSLPAEIKEKVNAISLAIVDEFGRVRQDIIAAMTPEERVLLQDVANVYLPEPEAYDAEPTRQSVVTELTPDRDGRWRVLADSDALLSIPRSVFQKPVEAITVTIQTAAYVLQYNPASDAYESVVSTPAEKGEYEMLVRVIYQDNSFDEIRKSVLVDPYGMVYTRQWKAFSWRAPWRFFMRERVPVVGATVSLYTKNRVSEWALWPAALYNQFNPQIAGAAGTFAFFVPAGEYRLEVSHPAFAKKQSTAPFFVEDDIVNIDIFLPNYGGFWARIVFLLAIFGIIGILLRKLKKRL